MLVTKGMYIYTLKVTRHLGHSFLSYYRFQIVVIYLSDFLSKLGPYSNAEFDYMDGENGSVDPKHETQVSIFRTLTPLQATLEVTHPRPPGGISSVIYKREQRKFPLIYHSDGEPEPE